MLTVNKRKSACKKVLQKAISLISKHFSVSCIQSCILFVAMKNLTTNKDYSSILAAKSLYMYLKQVKSFLVLTAIVCFLEKLIATKTQLWSPVTV